MKEPIFLNVEQVKELHRLGLEAHGGQDGLREPSIFEGAVMHPQNVYYYGEGDLFDIAAAYCFHLAQSQAFLDGNKRTAALATITFLDLNGIRIEDDSMDLYDAMIAIAEHRLDKNQLANVIKSLVIK